MFLKADVWQLSGSDLAGHLNCRHLTELEIAVSRGLMKKSFRPDPALDILRERGQAHEEAFLRHLEAQGIEIVRTEGVGVTAELVAFTLAAMRRGVPVIAQGALHHDGWAGRADVLRRVEQPSNLGSWSYEVLDTKLATETRGGTVLQLCLYSELLGFMQGCTPEWMYVVTPWTDFHPQGFRVSEYSSYFRYVKAGLAGRFPETEPIQTYPEPKEHCEVCHWEVHCDSKRREDDHLCLVAGISKVQTDELAAHGVTTMAQLAGMSLPLDWKPTRGSSSSYARIREQARLQVQGRLEGKSIFEALPIAAGNAMLSLPEPSPGDMFFDLEGDPFVGQGGLEFLFGYVVLGGDGKPEYTGKWCFSRAEERAVFEDFIDMVMDRWAHHPGMHIFHFAPYEPSALKRLMGRYATREEEIDRMLRAELFVDLYAVVRQSVRASVESYSIKRLEVFYGFERATPLKEVGPAMTQVQAGLELNRIETVPDMAKRVVIEYNRDDCVSTWLLRDWLEHIRADLVAQGNALPRPTPENGQASEKISERGAKIADLVQRLTAGVPVDPTERTAEQQGRWLLAHILDWHRREEKATWWEFFRLCDLPEEDLLEEKAALAGLEYVGEAGSTLKAPIHRYRFPPQETELRGGEKLYRCGGENYGAVERISFEECLVDIKKRQDSAIQHAPAIFTHNVVPSGELADSLLRIGEYVAQHGLHGEGPYQAVRSLLLKERPQPGDEALQQPDESAVDAACRVALTMTSGILPIQGPPGAGKTYTGAQMICALVKAGRKVGITANSHKVIRNLLDAVIDAAGKEHVEVCCIQKAAEKEEDQPGLTFAKTNDDLFSALNESCQVAGGTAWVWARAQAVNAVDVLFVDEAAQMSLANVLAISPAARTVVLLGDPQQLDQPMQGSHPEGTAVSTLEHLLDGERTIAADRGIFLEQTWRLHPNICRFTSEMFYEGRLTSQEGRERQIVKSAGAIQGAGLRYIPVQHLGNQSSSPEEADTIAELVNELQRAGTTWVDHQGVERPLTLKDLLIVAPYNAQIFELKARMPEARIGTVDKFQGQEAPISIYSLTTSTHADAPRGMEFLYSLNRLNVATSRAKCICILVGSPLLFEADCRTPRQMQLANAFCRYLELAQG